MEFNYGQEEGRDLKTIQVLPKSRSLAKILGACEGYNPDYFQRATTYRKDQQISRY